MKMMTMVIRCVGFLNGHESNDDVYRGSCRASCVVRCLLKKTFVRSKGRDI